MTVASDREKIAALLASVEELEDIARTLDDERRARLLRVARQWLATCEPIRPVIAAELLDLSEPTIREWARTGIFAIVEVNGQPRLEPRRFHEVWHLIRDLRAAGQTRGLLDAVWRYLEDTALLERDDVRESLAQMRRGEGRAIDTGELLARTRPSQA
ncbi:hypothetical protein Cme02nite_47990 [Catellatospora methionotrophica]|uniref:Uncharacterized protein n=1 Tax=Catellatospora methionotrophica TaxID=121620 RepID=A0A8J3L8Q0_9ACTN|nr:hypothetical protein [Catellatospora methionotrophica]GIG16467.1 hypothetical protein Cme02nite_47990 [Catellatospora methionotrophica]